MSRFDILLIILLVLAGIFFFAPITPTESERYIESIFESPLEENEQDQYPFVLRIDESYQPTQIAVNNCTGLLEQGLQIAPKQHIDSIKELELTFDPFARRGLAGGGEMILRCSYVEDAEFIAVFLHELAHNIDTAGFTGSIEAGLSPFKDGDTPIYKDDLSVEYYSVSWQDSETEIENSASRDFCSGYGSNDHFEDFAECYAFYILHGRNFRYLTHSNRALRDKYEFLKKYVFSNKEYNLPELEQLTDNVSYDVTVLPYLYSKLVNSSL